MFVAISFVGPGDGKVIVLMSECPFVGIGRMLSPLPPTTVMPGMATTEPNDTAGGAMAAEENWQYHHGGERDVVVVELRVPRRRELVFRLEDQLARGQLRRLAPLLVDRLAKADGGDQRKGGEGAARHP